MGEGEGEGNFIFCGERKLMNPLRGEAGFLSLGDFAFLRHCSEQALRENSFLARWEYMDMEDLAKRIRDTCIEAALQAYEDAGIKGLCAEGRWEAAVSALKTIELAPLLREFKQPSVD